jgi:hypothetical protein
MQRLKSSAFRSNVLSAFLVATVLVAIPGWSRSAASSGTTAPSTQVGTQESDFEAAGVSTFSISPNYPTVSTQGGTFPVDIRIISDAVATLTAMTVTIQPPAGWPIARAGDPSLFNYFGTGTCESTSTGTQAGTAFTATGTDGRRGCDFPFTVTVPPGTAPGLYSVPATATVTAGDNPNNPQNGKTATLSIVVQSNYDLSAAIATPLPTTYAPGEAVSAAIAFQNAGPDTAHSATVTVGGSDLAANLDNLIVTCTQDGGACAGITSATGPDVSGNWTYEIDAIAAGASPLFFTVAGTATANPSGPITVQGSISTVADQSHVETNGGNNAAATSAELLAPSPTPTHTPSPTPTQTPWPTATSTPTDVPADDVELTISGDPRFPVNGTVALATPGLTYRLLDASRQGSVAIQPDGSFTYMAAGQSVTSDQFIVRASDGTVITVNLVLEIDKSVPTYGEVKPGDTGYAGPVEDSRNPGNTVAQPTDVPDDDNGDEPVEAR